MRRESEQRPLDDSLAETRTIRCETVAAALALIAVALLSAIALADPPLAARLTVENGVIEWFQVFLDAGAALLFARDLVRNARETGRVSPLELAIVACLIGLIMGEVDLDRVLFGTKVASTRFFLNGKVAIYWRALAFLFVWAFRWRSAPSSACDSARSGARAGPQSLSHGDACSRRAWPSRS